MSFLFMPRLKLFAAPTAALLFFCILLILSKSFQVMGGPLECHLLDAIFALLTDTTPSPSRFLDAIIDVILPKLYQYLLSVFLRCSYSLGKGSLHTVNLENFCSSLIHW